MTRDKAKNLLAERISKTWDSEIVEAMKVALKSIESMEKMKEDTERMHRDIAERIRHLRITLKKEIKNQEMIPSWSYVRGLEYASGLVEEHLTRIEGLRGEEHEED